MNGDLAEGFHSFASFEVPSLSKTERNNIIFYALYFMHYILWVF